MELFCPASVLVAMNTEPHALELTHREASAAGLMVGIVLLAFLGMLVFVVFAYV